MCAECPSDFIYVPSVKGCYKPVTDSLSWDVATLRCRSYYKSAHLVFINNQAEMNAVVRILSLQNGKVTSEIYWLIIVKKKLCSLNRLTTDILLSLKEFEI
jgi:hypothetical protein